MKISASRIGFIGFGHMAQILFRSIDLAKLIPRSQILFTRRDQGKMRKNEQEFGITSASLETLVEMSDLIFLCIRPQQADMVLEHLAKIGVSGKRIVSILAGLKISYFEKRLDGAALIRAMPNLPAELGEGVTILSYGARADLEFCSLVKLFFQNMGLVVELSEQQMDLATGIAGSGPAYVFSLIEAAARLGESGGIPYEKALKIAAQMFFGSAKVLLQDGVNVSQLIQTIIVPNGTTEAGMKTLKESEVEKRFAAVLNAASLRSKEISECSN